MTAKKLVKRKTPTQILKAQLQSTKKALRVSTERIRILEEQAERAHKDNPEVRYRADVRETAEEFVLQWESGNFEDRESALDALNETIDGHSRVIYTYAAQDCLRYSSNDGAYIEEFGAEGLINGGALNWSKLAYAAFMADVQEAITRKCVNLNDEPPKAGEQEDDN